MGKSRNLAELGAGKLNTHLVPASDSAYDLGHSDYKIRSLYVSGNTLFLGDSGSISSGPDGIEMPALKIGSGDNKVILSAQPGGKLKIKEEKDSAGAPDTAEVDFATETYVTATIDSAYIQTRQLPKNLHIDYIDSATAINIIDSAYVYNRAFGSINAGINSFIFTATAGMTTVIGLDDNSKSLSFSGTNIVVNLNGVTVLDVLDYTTLTNKIEFLTPLSLGDQVHIIAFNPATTNNLTEIFDSNYLINRLTTLYPAKATKNEYVYTTTAAQISFTGQDSNSQTLAYDSNTVEVFANGIRLFKPGDYTATDGTSITLDDSIGEGSQVVIVDRSSLFGIHVGETLNLNSGSIPATSTSSGIKGTVLTDANYMYVCTATNVWVRSSIDTSW